MCENFCFCERPHRNFGRQDHGAEIVVDSGFKQATLVNGGVLMLTVVRNQWVGAFSDQSVWPFLHVTTGPDLVISLGTERGPMASPGTWT